MGVGETFRCQARNSSPSDKLQLGQQNRESELISSPKRVHFMDTSEKKDAKKLVQDFERRLIDADDAQNVDPNETRPLNVKDLQSQPHAGSDKRSLSPPHNISDLLKSNESRQDKDHRLPLTSAYLQSDGESPLQHHK